MCSGRVDLGFIQKAFASGQDGVFIGACRLNECNYVTHGNYDAFGNVLIFKKIMQQYLGLDPERLHIEFMSAADGNILADSVNRFVRQVKAMGPLGQNEGVDQEKLRLGLKAVGRLVPYLRLVERERFRIPVKTREAYEEFYSSREFERLFQELIGDRLAMSQIMLLLARKPMTTGEMAAIVGLNQSEISSYMNSSSRQGLVRYDEAQKRYALA